MNAIAKRLARVVTTDVENVDIMSLETVLIFCGIGLLVSLITILSYGIDLIPGFF
jgi:hypothetical protein